LNHNPVSLLGTVVKGFNSNIFLTLSHGNIDQRSISD